MLGTFVAFLSAVVIGIPVSQERISPVLDTAGRLLLVSRRRGKEVARKEFALTRLPPEALAGCIAKLQVDLLICEALSASLWQALERRGVHVRPHLCGNIEAILNAFDQGQLRRVEFRMPGCWGWHSDGLCCQRRRRTARAGMSEALKAPRKTSA